MKQNNFGRFVLVVLIVLWALYEIYPPTSRDLIQEFSRRAENRDAAFTDILARAGDLQKTGTNSEFASLEIATGTNDLQKYFPFVAAKEQLHPNTFILNRLQRDAAGKIKLGIDLQGGTSFLVEMDTNVLFATDTNSFMRSDVTSAALSQAIDVLGKRVNPFGVAEPVIQSAGENRILIQLPGLSQADKENAKEQIQKKAFLEFRLVNEKSAEIVKPATGEILQPVPLGYQVMKLVESQSGKQADVEYLVIKKKPENNLVGDIIKNARMGRGSLGEPEIDFTLTDEAAKEFGDLTREYSPDPKTDLHHRLAIILDGEVYSAPFINGPIETGSGMISGHFTTEEAQQLASVMQNPLKAPLHIVYSTDIDPTLGKDSIRSGIRASLAAVVLVSVFMLLYYRFAGLTANIALIINIIILLGVMCSIGTTLTLPGIAGVVLTIGMAVDANVLIYERLREELAKGKSLRGAIDAGYKRAFGTIFDSHVTTLISSIILIWQGTGEIKGFGVTLTIGVAASLFTALVVTRLIFNFMLDKNLIKSLPMFNLIKSAKVNFMGAAKPLFILTWLFIFVSLGFGLTRGPKLFGVDFRGGNSTIYSFSQKVGVDEIRSTLTSLGEKDPQIQFQKDVSTGAETLRLTTTTNTPSEKIDQALASNFPQAQFHAISKQQVGATVGEEIQRSAVVASLMAMLGILIYVAFRY
jgi:SecD/SecF fusion protein